VGNGGSCDGIRTGGAYAAAARTVPEAARRTVIESRLPVHEWPDRALRVTAADVQTGELRVFDRDSGAGLIEAAADNADLAAGRTPLGDGSGEGESAGSCD
jgi:NTE family protein